MSGVLSSRNVCAVSWVRAVSLSSLNGNGVSPKYACPVGALRSVVLVQYDLARSQLHWRLGSGWIRMQVPSSHLGTQSAGLFLFTTSVAYTTNMLSATLRIIGVVYSEAFLRLPSRCLLTSAVFSWKK